jgi:acyl-[acyl carrier protein]--UDP-N-acetylglucosamine O-acyltransferase
MNGKLPTIHSVEYRRALVSVSARVAASAVVGCAAEWRSEPTRFSAIVEPGVTIRDGVRVQAGAHRETVIGKDSLLMGGAHVGHDTQLGTSVEVGPNAIVGGCCSIGSGTRIGGGAVIISHITIGENVRIGAGAVVTRDIPANQTWAGNPAKRYQ